MRIRLKSKEAEFLGLEVIENRNDGSGNPRYDISHEQFHRLQEFRESKKHNKLKCADSSEIVKTQLENDNQPLHQTKYYWAKTENGSYQITNPHYKELKPVDDFLNAEFITEIVKSYIKPLPQFSKRFTESKWKDRLIISDVHINMNNHGGSNKLPIYDEPLYDESEIFRRLHETIQHAIECKRGDDLIIDNLGDFMDGEKGQTTRGGHALPQLYSDKKAFEIAVRFKMELVESLLQSYNHITLNNIIDDNHSFLQSYYVHSTVQKVLTLKYPDRVTYNINECFISHYWVAAHRFVISHGKDSIEMKFGWKPKLDDKLVNNLDGYMKYHKLYDGKRIEVSKGDSHQYISDFTTSLDFEYHTYIAFSPPSCWVQHNHGNSKSGVIFQNLSLTSKIKQVTPLFF